MLQSQCNLKREKNKLTIKGQISKESSQQVHEEHGQEGHIGNALHLSAGTAVWMRKMGCLS